MNEQPSTSPPGAETRPAFELKRIEFTIRDNEGKLLQEPGFVEDCLELPHAIKQAVEDFLDAYNQKLDLPLTIHVNPNPEQPTC